MTEANTERKEKDQKQQRKAKAPRPQVNPLVRYFRETRGELRKVTWPTWEETWRLTLIVLAVSAVTALFLGVILDSFFSFLVQGMLQVALGI